jgi:hypothetical protein
MKKIFPSINFYLLPLLVLTFAGSCNESRSSDIHKAMIADTKAATASENKKTAQAEPNATIRTDTGIQRIKIDTAEYNNKMLSLANHDAKGKWPAKGPYPLPGALLPYNRIVAFYGNLYSKKMGILGELPKDAMLKKLQEEVAKWEAADSSTPVIPCLHYIAVTAQGYAGKDGKHRLRMPFKQIDTVMSWAKEINGLVFLDIQVAGSTVNAEIPQLVSYLKLPNVHLGIDPEFSLKNGEVPGTRIGTFNEDDINFAIDFLADLVKKNNLPPKVLVVHRFTQGMITGYDKIKKIPEVQVVIDMDGWGSKILKKSTWDRYIYREPVQFTGFKLFYKNDIRVKGWSMYTPQELLKFTPKPIYIQYQ